MTTDDYTLPTADPGIPPDNSPELRAWLTRHVILAHVLRGQLEAYMPVPDEEFAKSRLHQLGRLTAAIRYALEVVSGANTGAVYQSHYIVALDLRHAIDHTRELLEGRNPYPCPLPSRARQHV
jgi:hypothetical protein